MYLTQNKHELAFAESIQGKRTKNIDCMREGAFNSTYSTHLRSTTNSQPQGLLLGKF